MSLAPTPVIYWFDGAANESCEPWISTSCGQKSICGQSPAKIPYDIIDTYLNLGTARCSDPVPTLHSGTFSILAATCPSRFSCPMREFHSFEITPPKVKKALGCLEVPEQDCDRAESCTTCVLDGVPADGMGPRIGGKKLNAGGGAYLYYAAGGVGFPGLPGSAAWNVTLGRGWSHSYAQRIVPFPDENRVFLITETGVFREWSQPDPSGVYQVHSPSSEKRTLTWLGVGAGWTLAELDATVHEFGTDGRWLSTTDRNGNAKTASYVGGRLDAVAFPDLRTEAFAYDPGSGKLDTITEVGVDLMSTRVWQYTWNGDDLVRVDRPDDTALLFTYGDAGHPGYLTRIELEGTDGTSTRVLRGYEYTVDGLVSRTWRGDVSPVGPDAVEVWSLALDDPQEPTVATVTDPLDREITYQLGRDTVSNNVKVLQIDGDCPVCGLAPNTRLTYDDVDHNPLLPTAIVDGRGTTTSFSYDPDSGQTLTRTEAAGDAMYQRVTSWTYDTTYPALVTSIQQPSVAGGGAMRVTDLMRDGSGNVTDRIISGVEAGSAFSHPTVTSYTFEGQVDTIDPDGHGTDDQTRFTYDPDRGNLFPLTRTDPIVGVTAFGYDPFNRRTSVTGPNGVTTTTSYDDLDRVTEVRQEGASPPTDDLVTAYTYTVFRDLFQTILPEGNVIEYGYDAAGRLLSVERKPDAATHGERVVYTLDEAGNRTLEELQRWDAGASAWVTVSSTAYEYTNRCQVDRIVQAPASAEEAVTAFEYDCNGNLAAQWDTNHDRDVDPPTTSYDYDPLDRLTSVSQPWEGAGGGDAVTSYAYDVQDHLVSVTDAEQNVTNYVYSDRDLLTSERSSFLVPSGGTCLPAPSCDPTPGCGCTTHGYDEHGELITTTDARGVTVAREVDALDRVTLVNYPDDALDTDYDYDAAPASCSGSSFPAGRLGVITRGGETVEYCYDRFGRTTKDGELTYLYDGNGNRIGIGYPGNVSATYGFDFADREVSLSVTSPGGTEPVVSAASYLPSGPLSSLALGSGVTEARGFDGRYGPTSIGLSGALERTFTYTTDPVGNVLGIIEQGACTPGPVVLENQTVTSPETFTSCTTIEAGNGFTVEGPDGDVTFQAQGTIALKDGFSVGAGARFAAGSGAIPPLSVRSYAYQTPQYFLTAAAGPWGTLDWTYDKIGNRITESRNGGLPDGYAYLTNGTGNTPILDHVTLGLGGMRTYTWGTAGHLEEVAAGANVLDFGADAEGRLSGVDRAVADEQALFAYDGRSFLRSAQEMSGDPPVAAASVAPLYDSAGLVHALRRRASPTGSEELVVFLYLAGRPVAQLDLDGSGGQTWMYLTTDHLGTPLLATDDAGAVAWEGGLEPFGTDYQANTMAGALENGIYLRLPGQWEDTSWQDASSGSDVYYNVWRFLEPQTGRYTRTDPLLGDTDFRGVLGQSTVFETLSVVGRHPYLYARAQPTLFVDLVGLVSCNGRWVPYGFQITGDPRSTGATPMSNGARGSLPPASRIPNASGPNPAGPPGGRPFQIIAPGMCTCRWLCEPCEGLSGIIYAPGKLRLPITRGASIHTGRDITSGDNCLCLPPGPETGCDKEDLCVAPPYYLPPIYDF